MTQAQPRVTGSIADPESLGKAVGIIKKRGHSTSEQELSEQYPNPKTNDINIDRKNPETTSRLYQ